MDIRSELSGDCLILAPTGRLDGHGASLLQQVLTDSMQNTIKGVIFDLENVPYLSSAGIRTFLIARNLVKGRSGKVALCNLSEFPQNVIVMAGMDKIFPIYPDRTGAISAIRNATGGLVSSPPTHPVQYQVGEAVMEVQRIGTGTSVLQISGSLTRVLHAGITLDDVDRIQFSECEYSIGLGALAENREQARVLLGEMITLHGSIVWLPTDGNSVPDYFIPLNNTGKVEIYSGFSAALQGPFHDHFTISTDYPTGISLSEIFKGIFTHAQKTQPDYAGIVAIALIGESCGVRSSGIRHPPIPENAPADGGSIMDPAHVKDWIEVMDEPQYLGETVVAFGIGIDLRSDLTRFDPDDLSALYYIHPANRVSQEMFLHTHGVVFSKTPQTQGIDIGRDIKRILISGEFLDMRHLMDDTRFRKVRGAVAYISAIYPGTK